jgi:RNA-binding protein YhbY
MKTKTIVELMKLFDDAHLIKQIILIGNDGVTRNIELEFVEDDEE